MLTRRARAALAAINEEARAASCIGRFMLLKLRSNASSVLNDRDRETKVPLCPISTDELVASSPRLIIVNKYRQVCYYHPQALYEFMTKTADFREPLTRRELNRVEVYRCARMQSKHGWVGRTICAYAMAIYDARVAKNRENQEYRQAVRSAVEVQQHTFSCCLDQLRQRHRGIELASGPVWDLWLIAVHDLRHLDPHCAMHETVSQMDMFMLQRELRPIQHVSEYGNDSERVLIAFTRALEMFNNVGVAVPSTTIARVTRMSRAHAQYRARQRDRQQQRALLRLRVRRRRRRVADDNDSEDDVHDVPSAPPPANQVIVIDH